MTSIATVHNMRIRWATVCAKPLSCVAFAAGQGAIGQKSSFELCARGSIFNFVNCGESDVVVTTNGFLLNRNQEYQALKCSAADLESHKSYLLKMMRINTSDKWSKYCDGSWLVAL